MLINVLLLGQEGFDEKNKQPLIKIIYPSCGRKTVKKEKENQCQSKRHPEITYCHCKHSYFWQKHTTDAFYHHCAVQRQTCDTPTERGRFKWQRRVKALTRAAHRQGTSRPSAVQAQAQIVGRFIKTENQVPAADIAFFLPGALGNQCDEKVHFPESIDSSHAVHST